MNDRPDSLACVDPISSIARGIVDDERDVSERPQGDPEVPALGESDPERGRRRGTGDAVQKTDRVTPLMPRQPFTE